MIYGYVKGAALEAEVKRLVEEWRIGFPSEYAHWDANCRAQKDNLRNLRAFSEGKTMQFVCALPAHVHMGVGRFLQNQDWSNDPETLATVLRCLPNAQMYQAKA